MLPPGSRGLHAAACGDAPLPGRGANCCRAAAGALQKGVQDTTKDVVSYTPSCDSP